MRRNPYCTAPVNPATLYPMKTTKLRLPPVIPPAKWAKMSATAKRVAIAKDAIFRVKSEQIEPESGSWVWTNAPERWDLDMQQLLAQGETCNACALGGAVCALAHFEDKLRYGDTGFDGETEDRLNDIFGAQNLRLIECAFELGNGAFDDSDIDDEKAMGRAIAFGKRYRSERNRFIAIWTNVAKHKGVFKP